MRLKKVEINRMKDELSILHNQPCAYVFPVIFKLSKRIDRGKPKEF